jgi:hypothetical protein
MEGGALIRQQQLIQPALAILAVAEKTDISAS